MSRFTRTKQPVVEAPKKNTLEEEYPEYQRWLERLKKGILEGIVKFIESNPERQKILLDDESMLIWAAVLSDQYFTFISYEGDETVGDGVVGGLLPDIAKRQYPYATPDQLTNLKNYYTSNVFQGKLMRDYKVDGKPFIETYMLKGSNTKDKSHSYRLTIPIYSDFYEAVFGGILAAGRRVKITTSEGVVLSAGMGWEYCERWFNHIFLSSLPNGRLDFENSKKTPDAVLTSLLSKFEYYSPETSTKFRFEEKVERMNSDPSDTRTVVNVSVFWTYGVLAFLRNQKISGLTDEQVELLPKNTDTVLVHRLTEDTKQEARLEASIKALNKLKEYGVTEKWAEDTKKRLDDEALKKDLTTKDAYHKILAYLKENGLENLRFSSLQKHASKEGRIVALQLIADKGPETIALQTRIFDQGDVRLCKSMLINIFAATI